MDFGRLGGVAFLAALVLATTSPAPPAEPAPAVEAAVPQARNTITFFGRTASLGALGDTVPSGQEVSRVDVPAWAFAPGRRPDRAVLATDGSVLMAGLSHNDSQTTPAGEMVIGAYDPSARSMQTVRLSTTTGKQFSVNKDGYQVAPTVSDLLPLPDGQVVFIASPTRFGQDLATDGDWPLLGVLTKHGGVWTVGNRWTGAGLAATTAGLGALACPPDADAPGHSECGHPVRMARFTASGDIIVAQAQGSVVALRLTGPDAAGRFAVKVTGYYRYPVGNVQPREVYTDPTGQPGDERFVVGFDVPGGPGVAQEFGYDAATGTIRPRSAPILPGDLNPAKSAFYGFGAGTYDHAGNLWLTRRDGKQGGKLAVYSRGSRDGVCPHTSNRSLDSYVTKEGGRSAWGRACRPDYDITQARVLPAALGIVEDAGTGTIVVLVQGGVLLPIRAAAGGGGIRFEIGNLVDLGHKLLAASEASRVDSMLGAAGPAGLLWFPTSRIRPAASGVSIDHWLVSVDLNDLFSPKPVLLPKVPGRSVTLQVERTQTTATDQRRGSQAAVDVDSIAHVAQCTDSPVVEGCGYDGIPGNGFRLQDSSGLGFIRGLVEYRIEVPASGAYRLSYHVCTFNNTPRSQIDLTVAGRTQVTPVFTGGVWSTVHSPEPIVLAAGVHTIRLSAGRDQGGWFLNSLTLRRV